ncbi:hypothetical protein BGX30_004380 [Mortierella sp. GBA39]|nr:hypothetical protein BGX30_004380 [Mortierella sp. GBA39]
MSTPACSKFFSVPELVEQLGPFLRPHDLAQLLRTSRSLYAATVLQFWRYVDLEDDHQVDQLITSPAALDALVKNAPFIHTLKAGFIFVSYYFEGVTRFLDEQEQEDEEDESTPRLITSNTRIKRPLWLPKAVTQTPQARSLPPMTRLTQLDICFDRRYRGVQFDNAMRIHSAVSMHLPLAWLMALNTTGLARVTFRHIHYSLQPLELRCLARSLSKLTNLTHFKTEMSAGSISESWLTPPMVPLLFFAFPTSVVSIKMEAHVRPWFDGDAEELELRTVQRAVAEQVDEEEGQRSRTPSLDWAEGDLMAREEPLENLKELELPTCSVRYRGHDISRIMEHCPALESWYIPRIFDDVGAKALSRTIRETAYQQHGRGQASRYLRHLLSNRQPRTPTIYHGEGWVRVLDSLPDQHVESVDFDQYLDSYPDKFVPALLRHSEVLRSVVFKNSHRIESRTVATILGQCHGLETFRATMPKEDAGRGFVALALNHAIEREWVCTRIKSLRFTVDLAVQEYSGSGTAGRSGGDSSGRAAYMSSFLKVEQPPKEHWTKLGAFYSQLGKLVELEDLEIFVAPPPMRTTGNVVPLFMNTASYSLRSLTGLLSLEEEDKETGKRGFLSLLGSLKKLRVVQGCFRTGTVETIETFGEREAEWILENWPALEAIEFLPEWYGSLEGFSMPKQLKGLHEKKPDLKLSL